MGRDGFAICYAVGPVSASSIWQAKRRIMLWCVRGMAIPDGPTAAQRHGMDHPRWYADADVPTEAELQRLADA